MPYLNKYILDKVSPEELSVCLPVFFFIPLNIKCFFLFATSFFLSSFIISLILYLSLSTLQMFHDSSWKVDRCLRVWALNYLFFLCFSSSFTIQLVFGGVFLPGISELWVLWCFTIQMLSSSLSRCLCKQKKKTFCKNLNISLISISVDLLNHCRHSNFDINGLQISTDSNDSEYILTQMKQSMYKWLKRIKMASTDSKDSECLLLTQESYLLLT